MDAPGRLDSKSWARVHFLEAPWCATCGAPFPYAVGDGFECGTCIAREPAYDIARAALAYDDFSRGLILEFKHGGRLDAVSQCASWMVRAGPDALAGVQAIIPVPLHTSRLRARRFNQSALLAESVSKLTGIPFEPDWLLRRRATPSQAGQSGKARRRNVAGAFKVDAKHKFALAGKTVAIIDDVMTTGATIEACAKAVKRAGVLRATALTLARVVKPGDPLT